MFGRALLVALAILVAWAVVARSSSGSGTERVYVVKPYDTLWAIAARSYAGDPREGVWKIQARNHLSGDVITPGERLRLP
jgi:LysM repeat protein